MPVSWRLGRALPRAAVLLVSLLSTAALAGRNPCEQGSSAPRQAGPHDGFLIFKAGLEEFRGRPVYAGDDKLVDLPQEIGQCVWVPLAPGRRKIRIVGAKGTEQTFTVNIVTRRTFLISLVEGRDRSGGKHDFGIAESLPRFALRVQGSMAAFPASVRSQLLDLAASAVPARMDLSDEDSSAEPLEKNELEQLLQKHQGFCDPKKQSILAELRFVLVLRATEAAPGQGLRFSADVYNTAMGAREPAITISEGQEGSRVCEGNEKRLQCLIEDALDRATTRFQSCLRLKSEPSAATVTIQPIALPKEDACGAEAGSTAPVRVVTPAGPDGWVEVPFFRGACDPVNFAIRVEKSRHAKLQQEVSLPANDVFETTVQLQRLASVPIYKRWWFWQIIGSAAAIAIGGGVGAAYSNDGGRQ